jgi:hypothetical protein
MTKAKATVITIAVALTIATTIIIARSIEASITRAGVITIADAL